jgi:cytosine deaminase
VTALAGVRRDLEGTLELQLVAMPVRPVSGPQGAEGRASLEEALAEGADVVGGCPWLDPDPLEAIDVLTATAAQAGLPIDLHIDECTDEGVLTIERFASRVSQLGLGGRATASHCVSLGQQPLGRARALARQLADAGVAVVTLPQTNLWLQGRGRLTLTPRGLAPVALLEEAGVLVCAGGDNWRDHFNPLGRADPLETAALLVAAGHLDARRAYSMVSEAARASMGLGAARLQPGDQADFLAIRASGRAEAVAGASEHRTVVHRGRVVARTEVKTHGVLWP